MAEHLAIQSHRTRLRGYNKIAAATAGGPQSGFSEFMGQMFCGSLASGSSRSTTQGGGDVEGEPRSPAARSRPPSPAARSTASMDVDDFCPPRGMQDRLPHQCRQSYDVRGASRISFAPHQRRPLRMPLRGVWFQDVRQTRRRLPRASKAPWDRYRVPCVRAPLLQAAGVDGPLQIKTRRPSP